MNDGKLTLDRYFPEMRWRCLSLAADLDRVQRGEAGAALLKADPRLLKLRRCFQVLTSDSPGRAEQVLKIFSDTSPPPSK